jgi:hydroxylaminobenzene mutase
VIWSRVHLAHPWEIAAAALCSYSAYLNWFGTLLAGIWGAGRDIAPIASSQHKGTPAQEATIKIILTTVGVTLLIGIPIVFVGLLNG